MGYVNYQSWLHLPPMKVFLSWSGEPSKAVAQALREWLPLVIQSLDPWMSQRDLGAGDRWSAEIQSNLAESKFGIVCVTPDNQKAPWLNFEAGAISNSVTAAKVVPYIHEMEFADISPGPLTQFQAKQASREGTLEVIQALNAILDRPLQAQVLLATFDMAWPRLEDKLHEIPQIQKGDLEVDQTPQRTSDDKLDEVLVLLRRISVDSAEKILPHWLSRSSFVRESETDQTFSTRVSNEISKIVGDFDRIRGFDFKPDSPGGELRLILREGANPSAIKIQTILKIIGQRFPEMQVSLVF